MLYTILRVLSVLNFLIIRWLDKKFGLGSSPKVLLPKLVCDDMIFVPAVDIPLFFGFTSLAEGEDASKRFEKEYKTAVLYGIIFNVPLTLINFALVPPPFRVIFLDVGECAWTCILSYVTHLVDE